VSYNRSLIEEPFFVEINSPAAYGRFSESADKKGNASIIAVY
jgi:hypothetical protein